MDVTINHDDLQLLITLAGMGVDTMQGTQMLTDLQCEQYERIAVAHRTPAGLPPKAQARLNQGVPEAAEAEIRRENEAQAAKAHAERTEAAAELAAKDAADRQRLEYAREHLVARLERDPRVVAADRTVPPVLMPLKDVEGAIASVMLERNRSEVTKMIKGFLKARTGRDWSVTGGTGTAWGWLRITAPKGRKVDFRATMEDQILLGLAMGCDWPQESFSVASSDGHWLAALQRAAGLEVTGSEVPYWD